MKNSKYPKELKEKILKLYLEQGRSGRSLTQEYQLGRGTLSYWLKEYRKECTANPKMKEQYIVSEEMRQLHRENEELRKENQFLKKAAAFFAKEV